MVYVQWIHHFHGIVYVSNPAVDSIVKGAILPTSTPRGIYIWASCDIKRSLNEAESTFYHKCSTSWQPNNIPLCLPFLYFERYSNMWMLSILTFYCRNTCYNDQTINGCSQGLFTHPSLLPYALRLSAMMLRLHSSYSNRVDLKTLLMSADSKYIQLCSN